MEESRKVSAAARGCRANAFHVPKMTPSFVARAVLRDATRASLRSQSALCRFGYAGRYVSSPCVGNRNHLRTFSTVVQVEDDPAKQPVSTVESSTIYDASSKRGEDPSKPQKPAQVKISEVLKRKHTLRWVEPVISNDATVREAITLCIERNLNGMMVVDRSETIQRKTTTELKQKVVGLLTSRDILRMLADSIKEGKSSEEVLNAKIDNQMTPINQVIYGKPDETLGQCRAIMAKLGIKCLPILSQGRVEGILTGRDMSDFYFDAKDRGGKQNYLRDISERTGLSAETSMAEPPVFVRKHLALRHAPLYLNAGVAEYPHPFKTADGIGSSRRSELALLLFFQCH